MWEGACTEQEAASWLAGLFKGIRELDSRPLILRFSLLCPLSLLTLPSVIQIKTGFREGFCFPRNPSLHPPTCSSSHRSRVESKRKLSKSNKALGTWGRDGEQVLIEASAQYSFLKTFLITFRERTRHTEEAPFKCTALYTKGSFSQALSPRDNGELLCSTSSSHRSDHHL